MAVKTFSDKHRLPDLFVLDWMTVAATLLHTNPGKTEAKRLADDILAVKGSTDEVSTLEPTQPTSGSLEVWLV